MIEGFGDYEGIDKDVWKIGRGMKERLVRRILWKTRIKGIW